MFIHTRITRIFWPEIPAPEYGMPPQKRIRPIQMLSSVPMTILVENEETCIRIPMLEGYRSLNLSNSVAIVLYEALRQQDFKSLERDGELHRLHWKSE